MTLPNCIFCGRFVGWKKGYMSWVPYGSANDLEPPDEEYAHLVCWNNPKNARLSKLIESTSWWKPRKGV